VTLVYGHREPTTMQLQTKRVNLSANLLQVTDAATVMSGIPAGVSPVFDSTYTTVVFSDGMDLFEGRGTLSGGFTSQKIVFLSDPSDIEGSPTLSPDGRLIIYYRQIGANPPDLMVARRPRGVMEWEPAMPLPVGPGKINTPFAEYDPWIATNGDLIFSSTRASSGIRRQLFLARAMPR
jgi:hypothetical protein